MTINIVNIVVDVHDTRWEEFFEELFIQKVIGKVLDETGFKKKESQNIEVSISLTNDDFIQGLNAEFRGKDKPTNVLSFPQYESFKQWPSKGDVLLGDLILSFDTISKEAQEQNKPFHDHFTHLLVHGTLHLLGYDHVDDEEAEVMQNLEVHVLSLLGFSDPYKE